MKKFLLFCMQLLMMNSFLAQESDQSMKTIGLLGGTGWSSTIGYYTLLNQLVHEKLGGCHSAKVILKSIDYHDIAVNYGKNNELVSELLYQELLGLIELKPDCIIICCNSLHKFYDLIKDRINSDIPVFHAVELVGQHMQEKGISKALLLATKLTMEDGFFANILEKFGITVVIPDLKQRDQMNKILFFELINNVVTDEAKKYFADIILEHQDNDVVILGCTEFPLVVVQENSALPIINPVTLQCAAAVDFALK